jgi:aconitate hydratase
VVPLEFLPGESAAKLGLTGEEIFETVGLPKFVTSSLADKEITIRYTRDGHAGHFKVRVRIDTPQEAAYYQHGGILLFVLRQLMQAGRAA